VIGGGGHAKVVISVLKKLKSYQILGYFDAVNRGSILGIVYLGNDQQLPELKKKHPACSAVLGIGNVDISDLRYKIAQTLLALGFDFQPIISPDAIVNEEVKIGQGAVILDGVVVNSGTVIGAFAILNTKSSIDHDCSIGDFAHIAPGVTLSGCVSVGRGSLIGAGATVIQGKKIDENCLIGAGSVVVGDVEGPGIYFGVPARKQSSLNPIK